MTIFLYFCKVIVINGMDISDTEELAVNMMYLLASFSGENTIENEVLKEEMNRKQNKDVKSN